MQRSSINKIQWHKSLLRLRARSTKCAHFRVLYWINLFLLTAFLSTVQVQAEEGDVRAMMRAADQAFRRELAESFLRNAQSEQARVQKPVAMQSPDAKVLEEAPTQVAKADPASQPLPEATASSPAGFAFRDCDFCPPLVVVPKGAFTMGSNKHAYEKPAHEVLIAQPFAIGQHQVTYGEWDRCVDAGACRYRLHHNGSSGEPIGNLSWDDATEYLKWLSEKTGQVYRLPSEAEWEYATSADKGKFLAAGSQQANGDAARNLAEWVQDCWNEILSRSAHGRFGMVEGQLQPARSARRAVRQRSRLFALPLR